MKKATPTIGISVLAGALLYGDRPRHPVGNAGPRKRRSILRPGAAWRAPDVQMPLHLKRSRPDGIREVFIIVASKTSQSSYT